VFEHQADVYLPMFHPRVANGGSGQ
jgi:hypothetical protein